MVRFSVALVGTVVCCVEASLGGEPNIFRYITLEGKRRVDEKLSLGIIDFFRCQKCCTHYAAKVFTCIPCISDFYCWAPPWEPMSF